MDELLSGLHDAGTVESSARFSVDVLRAHQKLRQFQLADPGFYLLKLVQGAVAAGASGVAVRLNRDAVELGFDPQFSLTGLPQALLEGRPGSGAVHHLVVALSGALAWDPVELQFGVAGKFHLRLTADGIRALPPAGEGASGRAYFRMLKPAPTGFFQRWFQGAKANLAEAAALTGRCRFAPISISLDGRLVNAPFPEALAGLVPSHMSLAMHKNQQRLAGELIVWAPPGEAGLAAPLASQRRPAVLNEVLTGGSWTALSVMRGVPPGSPFPASELPDLQPNGDLTVYVGVYAGPFLNREVEGMLCGLPQFGAQAIVTFPWTEVPSQLVFVSDGVQLNTKTEDLGLAGALAVVASPGLSTDLSGFEVVEDARYREVLEWVRGQVRVLGETLARHVSNWQAADRLYLSDERRDDLRRRLLAFRGRQTGRDGK